MRMPGLNQKGGKISNWYFSLHTCIAAEAHQPPLSFTLLCCLTGLSCPLECYLHHSPPQRSPPPPRHRCAHPSPPCPILSSSRPCVRSNKTWSTRSSGRSVYSHWLRYTSGMSGIFVKRSLPEDMKCLQDAQKGVEYVHARVVLGGDKPMGIGEGAPADPEGEVNKPGDEERHRE